LNILVYIEERHGRPSEDSLGLLSYVSSLDAAVSGVVCGFGVREAAEEALNYAPREVFAIDDARLHGRLPQPYVDAVAQLVREQQIDAVLFVASVLASNLAGALAARLEAGLNWDLSDIVLREGRLVGRKLVLGDTACVEVGWEGGREIALFRPGTFEPHSVVSKGQVVDYAASIEDHSTGVKVVERWEERAQGSPIESADVLVAVGRGVGDRATLADAEELARELHGALAVTMPIVDQGWYSHANQVGQTGKTVRPRLYLAFGISGAIQHRIGMERSGTIVAVNTDPHAPIFSFSDLGVVADLHVVLPKLRKLVRAERPNDS
jgi:electron transfer flavoprotein alpha subunit